MPTGETVAIVDEVGTISEETTSQADSVAAASEEQTTPVTDITTSIESLSGQTGSLQRLLDQFDSKPDNNTIPGPRSTSPSCQPTTTDRREKGKLRPVRSR